MADSRIVSARAWCRVDLAGGTLDLWPLGLLSPNASTVNVAIQVPVRVELHGRGEGFAVEQGDQRIEATSIEELRGHPDTALVGVVAEAFSLDACEIRIHSGSPRGGGLGASSALTVALVAAAETWLGSQPSSARRRAAISRDLEARLMELPTGQQDHIAALLGGAHQIRHVPGGVEVDPIKTDLRALGRSLVVAYSGRSHFSAGNNWQVLRRRLDGDRDLAAVFDGLAGIAVEMKGALEAGDLPQAGRLLDREWGLRRQLSSEISTPTIEQLLQAARSLGAWGGKACGAGGGGCIAMLCPPNRKEGLTQQLTLGGFQVLADAVPADRPLLVEEGSSS
ncbi:MAG: hypothetical protein AAGD01_00405 [Acidobacteriota bacterium]